MSIALLGIIAALVAIASSKKSEVDTNTAQTEIAPESQAQPTSTEAVKPSNVDAVTGVDGEGALTTVRTDEGGPRVEAGSTSAEVSDYGTHPMRTDGGAIPDAPTKPTDNVKMAVSADLAKTARVNLPPRAYAKELQAGLKKTGVGF